MIKLEVLFNHEPLVRVIIEDKVVVAEGFIDEKIADFSWGVRSQNHSICHTEKLLFSRGIES